MVVAVLEGVATIVVVRGNTLGFCSCFTPVKGAVLEFAAVGGGGLGTADPGLGTVDPGRVGLGVPTVDFGGVAAAGCCWGVAELAATAARRG